MNKEQKKFHKVAKQRARKRAKKGQPFGISPTPRPADTRTPGQKHSDDLELAKKLGLGGG